jgi:hypothetical protein
LTGERAAYVRTSQRLAMLDRDFTAADYELLLGLDDNSQRLRQFLEGASRDTIERLPTYTYNRPARAGKGGGKGGGDGSGGGGAGGGYGGSGDADAEGGNGFAGLDDGGWEAESQRDDASEASGVEGEARAAAAAGARKVIEAEESEEDEAGEGGETATRCTICLERFADGMEIRILRCMHQFMVECIDPWLLQQAKCPVCKSDAV